MLPRRALLAGSLTLTTPLPALAAPLLSDKVLAPSARSRRKQLQLYDLLLIADQDKQASATGSPLCRLTLRAEGQGGPTPSYSIDLTAPSELPALQQAVVNTTFTSAGRGAEFSDLLLLPNSSTLITCDDHTGIVYSLQGCGPAPQTSPGPDARLISWDYWLPRTGVQGPGSRVDLIPRWILADGDGDQPRPFKAEWVAYKDGLIIVGSHGYDKQALRAARLTRVSTEPDTTLTQSFTAPQPIQRVSTQPDNNPSQPDNTPTQRLAPAPGPLVCVDPSRPANLKYVKQLNPTTGQVTHVDWSHIYDSIAFTLGVAPPGYVTHEAAAWSNVWQRWFFIPRRISTQAYDPATDSVSGGHVIISCKDDGSAVQITQIRGPTEGLRGCSALRFVPGTQDRHIVALKTVERYPAAPFETFITVLDVSGQVLLEETRVSTQYKFEGLEILSSPLDPALLGTDERTWSAVAAPMQA